MPSITQIARSHLTLATHRIHTMPIVVLMPHSRCNCRCVMCDIWKANQNAQVITAEQLEPHLETFRKLNVKQVVLSGGEALMHPNLWTLCTQLKSLDVEIILLSTGLLLKHHAHDIVTTCSEVIVSLDGSQDVHDMIRRVPRAYDRLAEGVSALRAHNPAFRVTGRCVLQRMNYHDLPHIIDTAHDLELDQISFLAADVSTDAFNRPAGWDQNRVAEVALNTDEVEEFKLIMSRTIAEYQADFASGFIAESPEKLWHIFNYYSALNGQDKLTPRVCNAPWVSTVIEADGTVRPCFFHRPLGNIHQQPLIEILNSDDAIAFRRQLDVTQDSICQKCVCTLNIRPFPFAR